MDNHRLQGHTQLMFSYYHYPTLCVNAPALVLILTESHAMLQRDENQDQHIAARIFPSDVAPARI